MIQTQNYALLTGGPSLATTWHDGMYHLFRGGEVWAVNMVGKEYYHDVAFYLDTPHRIFGEKGIKQWPKTMKGFIDHKPKEYITGGCSITFPAAFAVLSRSTPPGSRIYIFGWDCCGVGVVDGQDWVEGRTSYERNMVKQFWDPEKVAGVSGAMLPWARDELGFNAGPINKMTHQGRPERERSEKKEPVYYEI